MTADQAYCDSYGHDVDPWDVADWPPGPWTCTRPECGAVVTDYTDEETS